MNNFVPPPGCHIAPVWMAAWHWQWEPPPFLLPVARYVLPQSGVFVVDIGPPGDTDSQIGGSEAAIAPVCLGKYDDADRVGIIFQCQNRHRVLVLGEDLTPGRNQSAYFHDPPIILLFMFSI